jgi:hypothetical protein
MPRYIVERTFPDGASLPINAEGAQVALNFITRNAEEGVTWIRSHVTLDKKKTFCVYDGPTPEAIRRAADATGCRSTASPRCACSIRISTCEERP